jgi:hypothetical protein
VVNDQAESNLYLQYEQKGNDAGRYGNSDEHQSVWAYKGVPHTEQCAWWWDLFVLSISGLVLGPRGPSSVLLLTAFDFPRPKAKIREPKSCKHLSHSWCPTADTQKGIFRSFLLPVHTHVCTHKIPGGLGKAWTGEKKEGQCFLFELLKWLYFKICFPKTTIRISVLWEDFFFFLVELRFEFRLLTYKEDALLLEQQLLSILD